MAEMTPQQQNLLRYLVPLLQAKESAQAAVGPSALGTVLDMILPSSQTVEKMSYGDMPFRMPTQSRIPITTDKQYLADLIGVAGALTPAAKPVQRGVQQLVREIQTTAPRGQVKLPSTQVSPSVNLQMAKEAAEARGLSPDQQTRMRQLGFKPGWYHGTTGDIERFRTDLLGEATGAASAKKGFFFARDPIDPPQEVLVNPGSGARTASGYSLIGGDREYREAMRKASLAEKKQDWDEYEKQMSIAEDFVTRRMQNSQLLVAKYGDARDVMLEKVQNAFFSKQLPQAEAEALDAKYRNLMPYGWYNQFEKEQFDEVKKAIKEVSSEKQADAAIKAIDDFIKIKNQRALDEKTQSGSNVLPVALSYKNPMVYDFKGSAYREQTYSELMDEAIRKGHDSLILRNTFDPGAGKAELVDVGVVFDPKQIRSRFAAFDPTRLKESDILAGSAATGVAGLLGSQMLPDEPMY